MFLNGAMEEFDHIVKITGKDTEQLKSAMIDLIHFKEGCFHIGRAIAPSPWGPQSGNREALKIFAKTIYEMTKKYKGE